MSLIAITGGTGTLGQNLARTALARGHQVRIVSCESDSTVAKGAVLAVANVLTGKGSTAPSMGPTLSSTLRPRPFAEPESPRSTAPARSQNRQAEPLPTFYMCPSSALTTIAFLTTRQNSPPSRSWPEPKSRTPSPAPPSSTS